MQEELKAKLNELGNDASREEIKATVESFKENNQDRIEEIKATFASIREQLEAIHPEKPTRPELTNELKSEGAFVTEQTKGNASCKQFTPRESQKMHPKKIERH